MSEWDLRAATPAHLPEVRRGWLLSYRRTFRPYRVAGQPGSPAFSRWMERHGVVVDGILARPETETMVLVEPARPQLVVFGFICTAGPDVLHYVNVKPQFSEFATDMLLRMLGDRLERAQVLSHEVYGFGGDNSMFRTLLPRAWNIDEHWLARRMLEERSAA